MTVSVPDVIRGVDELPDPLPLGWPDPMRAPDGVLLCEPAYFDVVDVKNPHMADKLGTVDRALARKQWRRLADAFEQLGLDVEYVEPLPSCEDMVFCANQTFTGLDRFGRPLAILSRMRHESRRREIPPFAGWFWEHAWLVVDPLPKDAMFEGGGDALWHPGRRLIWAGHGFRSRDTAHSVLAQSFRSSVVSVRLKDERFYHLDTALCPIDERTAMLVPGALDEAGEALVRRLFERVIDVDLSEAVDSLAGNAAAFPGLGVVIDFRATKTAMQLEELGYTVVRVDTGEFLKSGGSVFCMKQVLWTRE